MTHTDRYVQGVRPCPSTIIDHRLALQDRRGLTQESLLWLAVGEGLTRSVRQQLGQPNNGDYLMSALAFPYRGCRSKHAGMAGGCRHLNVWQRLVGSCEGAAMAPGAAGKMLCSLLVLT